MALPTTAVQIKMMMAVFQRSIEQQQDAIRSLFFPRLFELIKKRTFLQRPRTDDMMQMLVDLGIEPPEDQPISYDGLTFRFRGKRDDAVAVYRPVDYTLDRRLYLSDTLAGIE